jgi:DNA-binding MarR family transcriptional regulator
MNTAERAMGYPLPEALEFLGRIWHLNHSLERLSNRMEGRLGVTAQQRFIIRCVGKYPGIAPGQLARILHLDPGTVSATLRRLEGKVLIERRPDERDRRRVTVGLTPEGRRLDRTSSGTVEHAVLGLLQRHGAGDIERVWGVLASFAHLLDIE